MINTLRCAQLQKLLNVLHRQPLNLHYSFYILTGSYYDFMNRFWLDPRDIYSRSFLLPTGKNGKKPKKIIGADGKLEEPADPCTVSTMDIVSDITSGKPASDNPEAALQKIFSILTVFPSVRLGLIDAATLNGDGTVTTKHGTSGTPFTCFAAGTIR